MRIYDQEVELPEVDPEELGVVVDVVVLARVLRFGENGRPDETLVVGDTRSTSPIIHKGMAYEYLDMLDNGNAYNEDGER